MLPTHFQLHQNGQHWLARRHRVTLSGMYPRRVRPKSRLVRVRLSAMFTNMGPFPSVRPIVDEIGTSEPESPAASFAVERSLVGMQSRMLDQLDPLRVSLSTRADKRPFSGMRAQVSSQVALRREVLVAHLARVPLAIRRRRRRPVVHVTEVKPQLSAGVEPLRTQAACVRVRRHVDCEVILEVCATDERTAAQFAHERLLAAVQWKMPAEVPGERETSSACLTFVRSLPSMCTFVQHQTFLLLKATTARLTDVRPDSRINQLLTASSVFNHFIRY